ncbi:lactonase family protein [Myceligenerans pegani]|uniref:Beta-propeller fold lactonase family protein n=1 Tax=Myceligenerans pegani TaxID=2776917 RepID=A0ABR9MUW2_9MICO|nr:beta-propeller fold lactonase family protein [Myceligenerans sp. TRM 65318]MBE1875172.1 beta-propeller fold lactonase family protein [Myceligenerans sp. TRM 65318]MBE3017443.1 beta-propeller fold lactonase family protein [Myceligenerans sp. TRM 65318]
MTSEQDSGTRSLWIGTYPRPGADPGSGEGVFRVDVDTVTGALSDPRRAIALPAPSFLAAHPSGRTLYAVGETDPGSLTVLGVHDDGSLVPRRTVASGGSEPCHVVAGTSHVWVANYADGIAAAWPTDGDGLPTASHESFGNQGSGPVPDRQAGPHAHSVHLPGDSATALVADLGTDELRTHRAAPDSGRGSELAATFPPGAGPRHLVELPDGALLVAGELDCHLHLLVPDLGPQTLPRYRLADGFAITGATWGPDGGPGFPSHLTLSPDGRYVHVGVRGPDVLAVLRLERVFAGWKARHALDVELGAGAWPRHHAVVGPGPSGVADPARAHDLIVVAAQNTGELISVLVDHASGTGKVVARLPFPVPPACVLVA